MAKKPVKKPAGNPAYIIACLAALVVIAVLLLLPQQDVPAVYGEFTPPPFESAAVAGVPDVPADLGWSELVVRDGFTVSVCGVLNVEDGQVAVWLYNHPGNDCWLKLRLQDTKGNILGQTGILRPGEYTQYITLDNVPQKDTTVILKLMGYTPEDYYSAGSMGLETKLRISR